MNQTQCCARKFLSFEGATIQTQNEATDCFVRGAVNHSAGSFGERSSCCFARNMSRDFSVPKQPSKQWFYGWCSLRSGASVSGCHHYCRLDTERAKFSAPGRALLGNPVFRQRKECREDLTRGTDRRTGNKLDFRQAGDAPPKQSFQKYRKLGGVPLHGNL